MLKDLILKNRSYRRFHQDKRVTIEVLRELVDLARHCASAANRQPLKYILSCDPGKNAKIFDTLAWAAYLKGWGGPAEGERPSAYIVILHDTKIADDIYCDHGIAAQSILLGGTERGLGGCMIASVNRKKLRKALDISPVYDIPLVLALGVPKETVVLEEVGANGDIRYWRDDDGVHHVPKRSLDDLVID